MTAYRTWFKSHMALHMWMISQDRLLASKKALVNRLIWQKRLLFRPNYFYEYLPTVASLKAAMSHCRGSHIKLFLDTRPSNVYSTAMRITLRFILYSNVSGSSPGLRDDCTRRNNRMKARVESVRWKLGPKVWDVSSGRKCEMKARAEGVRWNASRIHGTYSQQFITTGQLKAHDL